MIIVAKVGKVRVRSLFFRQSSGAVFQPPRCTKASVAPADGRLAQPFPWAQLTLINAAFAE
jgi:hypothetical protein